jgi:hypothetical protein
MLLHVINKRDDITEERTDLSPGTEFLQGACKKVHKDHVFNAHYHIPNERITTITQEAWVVMAGKIEGKYYDSDNTLLTTHVLSAGDVSITFRGGHAMRILEDNTLIYEFKTGPYLGQKKDKVWMT